MRLFVAIVNEACPAPQGPPVYVSTNNGTSWTAASTGLTNNYVLSLAVSPNGVGGTNLFAGTSGGVFLSTNNGTSWTAASTPFSGFSQMVRVGSNLFAGTYGSVFLSTNNGTSWSAVNAGLMNTNVKALAVSDTNLFAGTYYGGIWRRPLSEMITDVESEQQLPTNFALEQNFPNPFNPVTNFQFSIVNRQLTILKVYDLLGREIATLVNEEKQPGTHTVQWDASNVASGVYLYQLKAGAYTETRKLLLLK
jgi:hypothetical protein